MSAEPVYHVDLSSNHHKFTGVERIIVKDGVATTLLSGNQSTFVLRCNLLTNIDGDGVSVRAFLGDWESIDYVAIGYTHDKSYRHIKAKNVIQNTWFELGFVHEDMIWKIQNGYEALPTSSISDIKLFIKGNPGAAIVKLCDLQVLTATEVKILPQKPLDIAVVSVLMNHFRGALRDYTFSASHFLQTGQCPMPGKQLLFWEMDSAKPQEIEKVNSFRSSWHGMHLALALMLHAEDTDTITPLMAARAWVEQWLDNSYFKPDTDKKYAWYDHSTAERLMALLLLWHKTAEHGVDQRFANRLWNAINGHAELMNTEAFYACHQSIRYHNHAWFQDAALIAAALALPQHQNATSWLSNGIRRFEDQLEHLIVRDGGYAVFIENSIGYHQGVQKLANVVGTLVALSGRQTEIPTVAQELIGWSEFLRYPDGRVPAQGDTFRLPPRSGADIRSGKPWKTPSCIVMPAAGYSVIKGNHEGKPWMLCLFNTSLSETHKHEDNLSITFWFDGIEWLIDPSFYSHEYQEPVTAYLRSARAHNNLYLRNAVYSKELGVTNLAGHCASGEFQIAGSHRAYADYEISRVITGYLDKLELTVVDELTHNLPVGESDARLAFHFAENVHVSVMGNGYRLSHPECDTALYLRIGAHQGHPVQGGGQADFISCAAGQGFQQQAEVAGLELIPRNNGLTWALSVAEDVKPSSVDSL